MVDKEINSWMREDDDDVSYVVGSAISELIHSQVTHLQHASRDVRLNAEYLRPMYLLQFQRERHTTHHRLTIKLNASAHRP